MANVKENIKVKAVAKRTAVKSAVKAEKNKVASVIKAEKQKVTAVVKSANKRSAKTGNSKVNTDKLELLVTIVNRDKAEFYQDLLQRYEVNMQLSVRARGTARAQTLSLLGLESSPKTAIFSFIKEGNVADALAELETKFKTIKGGEGVAYTVPLTSVIGVAIFGFLSNNAKTVKEDNKQ